MNDAVIVLLALGIGATAPPPERVPPTHATQAAIAPEAEQTDVRLQCWQQGQRVVIRDRLAGVNIPNDLGIALNFSAKDKHGDRVALFPMGEGFCLIEPAK